MVSIAESSVTFPAGWRGCADIVSRLPQTSFFFCYMGMICYAFFLMLGAVGYRASLTFVRHIYR